MALLRTSSIQTGIRLAYLGEKGEIVLHEPTGEHELSTGDVVQVVEVSRSPYTRFAAVVVAVLKGAGCGRVGVVSVDMSLRSQRLWQGLTVTGSIEPQRRTSGEYSLINKKRIGEGSLPD